MVKRRRIFPMPWFEVLAGACGTLFILLALTTDDVRLQSILASVSASFIFLLLVRVGHYLQQALAQRPFRRFFGDQRHATKCTSFTAIS